MPNVGLGQCMKNDAPQPPNNPEHDSPHGLHIHQLDRDFVPGVRLPDNTHKVVQVRREMMANLIRTAFGWELAPGFQIRGRLVMVRLEPGLLSMRPDDDPAGEVLALLSRIGEIADITKIANATRTGEEVQESVGTPEAKKEIERLGSAAINGRQLYDIALSWLEDFARVRESSWRVGDNIGRSVEIVIPVRQQVLAMRRVRPLSPVSGVCTSGSMKVIGRCMLIRTIDSRYLIVSSGMEARAIGPGSRLLVAAGRLDQEAIEVRRASSHFGQGADV